MSRRPQIELTGSDRDKRGTVGCVRVCVWNANDPYTIHFSPDVKPIKYLDWSKEMMFEIHLSL